MRSAHTREQDFLAITAEVEVLCQQLKGRGTYTIPPMMSKTSSSKSCGSMHFQPNNPAQRSSVQAMDQSLLNSSLNLLDDSPQSQPSSSNGPIPHGKAMPQFLHTKVTTPYHPHCMSTKMSVTPKLQPQRLPFVDAPLAPTRNHQTDHASSPSMLEMMSKSIKRQGVKQSSSELSSASTSTGKLGPVCWNCQEVGQCRCNCKNPSYCSKCKQSGHLPMKCPLKGKKTEKSQTK